jgi:hypothetical protein
MLINWKLSNHEWRLWPFMLIVLAFSACNPPVAAPNPSTAPAWLGGPTSAPSAEYVGVTTDKRIMFRTSRGVEFYERCGLCSSVRLTPDDKHFTHPVVGPKFATCHHFWRAGIGAESIRRLTKGDVLLIKKNGLYYAVKVISMDQAGNAFEYQWFHQPQLGQSTFVGDRVEKGWGVAAGAIQFKDIDIVCSGGAIWYDFYFGGMSPASRYFMNPHAVAFAGKANVDQINCVDPCWAYKTWEDGR